MADEKWTHGDMVEAKVWMLRNADHARRCSAAYADDAKFAEAIDPVAAKRMKEAAHYYSVVAACLDGSRTFADAAGEEVRRGS